MKEKSLHKGNKKPLKKDKAFEKLTDNQLEAFKQLIPNVYLKFTTEEQFRIVRTQRFDNFEDVGAKKCFDYVKNQEGAYLRDKELMLEKDAFTNFKNGWLGFLTKDNDEKHDENPSNRLNNQITFNPDIHTIDIDNSLNDLLQNTKNELFPRPFPYQYIFFNRNLELEPNNYCFGISVFSSKCLCGDCKDFLHYVSLIGIDYNRDKLWKGCYAILGDKIFMGGYMGSLDFELNIRKICKQTSQMVVNLIDFMNHPEIIPKVIKWTNNENRIKRGKMPIPNRLTLKITGKMYHYLYENQDKDSLTESKRHYNCTFEVKGTYVHYYSQMRFHRLYSLTIDELRDRGYQIDKTGLISKWRLPFYKGVGIKKTKPIVLSKD
jgi:hypothetical protein